MTLTAGTRLGTYEIVAPLGAGGVYTLNGESDKATETLERLVRVPGYVTPGWVRIDPNFAPLRGNPRFQKLVAGAK